MLNTAEQKEQIHALAVEAEAEMQRRFAEWEGSKEMYRFTERAWAIMQTEPVSGGDALDEGE